MSIVVKEVRVSIAGTWYDADATVTHDRDKCHVITDGSWMTALCGLRGGVGIRVAEGDLHADGRCSACNRPTCLTCDLLARINVIKEGEQP